MHPVSNLVLISNSLAVICRVALVFAESNPLDLLPDGTPAHWSFTRNGTLRILAARADFPGGVHPPIPIAGNYNESLVSTWLFFSDSSWGKLNLVYTFPPIVNVTTSAASSTAGTIRTEALAALESVGYVYCGGPCGSRKASKIGQYDAVVLAFVAFPPAVDWAGLGVVGNGFTWTLYETSAGVLEHEIGHNFGMGHSVTTKHRAGAGQAYNTQDYEGYTRMGAGGAVYFQDEKSRYNDNGHFDPSCKHWFGWFEDSNVVFLHPNGSTASCPQCQVSWSGKLNAFDRPDVIPGKTAASSGSPYFAIKIAYTEVDLLYIYYRSSSAGTRAGVSVQYCQRSLASYLNVGMNSLCFTYDAAGDTATMSDNSILPGTTFVAAPPPVAIERIGRAGVAGMVPVISVQSVPNFSDCPDMICPSGKDISATLSVRFLTRAEAEPGPPPALTVTPSGIPTEAELALAAGGPGALIRAADAVEGAGGRGTLDLTVCPTQGLTEVSVYLYDSPPLATLLFSAPPAYQAINRFRSFFTDCCAAGEPLAVSGVRAVVIRQLDTEPLAIAELEVYLAGAPGVNVASTATCWSLPVGGSFYNGDSASGVQSLMTDGLVSTFSHSGSLNDGQSGRGHFDMCVFPAPVPAQRLTVQPRSGWVSRSKALSVETYAFVGADSASPSGLRPVGLLYSKNISMTTSVWSTNISLPAWPGTIPCEGRTLPPFTLPTVQGAAYALIRSNSSGAARVRAVMNSTVCPTGAHPVPAPGGNLAVSCTPCPDTALGFGDNMAVCPGNPCTALVVSGGYSGPYDDSRDLAGPSAIFAASAGRRPTYTSRANATIGWSTAARRWELRDPRGALVGARNSSWVGSFDAQEPGWANLSAVSAGDVPRAGIRAVVVEMDQAEILNLCEIEMYDVTGVNVARSRARCFNLPTSTGYYYTSNRTTGAEPKLNDGCTGGQDVCSCSHTGDSAVGNFVACILDAPLQIVTIQVYINPIWASRSSRVNLKLFSSLQEGPITVATFSKPSASRLHIDMQNAANRVFSLCYLNLGVDTSGSLLSVVGNSYSTFRSTPPSSTLPPSVNTSELFADTLAKHNTFRKNHQVPGLAWSQLLVDGSAAWAARCVWEHDSSNSGRNQGENLYASTAFTPTSAALSAAVDSWYSEITNYNYSLDYQPGAGHATQVLWKGTTSVGCAYQVCGASFTIPNGIFIVCRYSPAGNMLGSFTQNVFPTLKLTSGIFTAEATEATAISTPIQTTTTTSDFSNLKTSSDFSSTATVPSTTARAKRVSVKAVVRGYTKQTFRSDVYVASLASVLKVDSSRVSVRSVTEVQRRQSSGVSVDCEVSFPPTADSAQIQSQVAGAPTALTEELRTRGMTEASVASISSEVIDNGQDPTSSSQLALPNAAIISIAVCGAAALAAAALAVGCVCRTRAKVQGTGGPKASPPSLADSESPNQPGGVTAVTVSGQLA